MKRERRLYANGVGAYPELDDDAAYLQLVENVEAIIAEEQQVYWRSRGKQDEAARQNFDGEMTDQDFDRLGVSVGHCRSRVLLPSHITRLSSDIPRSGAARYWGAGSR